MASTYEPCTLDGDIGAVPANKKKYFIFKLVPRQMLIFSHRVSSELEIKGNLMSTSQAVYMGAIVHREINTLLTH